MNKLKKLVVGITGHKKSKEQSKAKTTYTQTVSINTPPPPPPKKKSRIPYTRFIQNFCLVWLDSNIDEVNDDDSKNTIAQLRQVVNTLTKFTDANECAEYITTIEDGKVFLISSGALGQKIVPVVHDMPQVNCIYIFCQNQVFHKRWAKGWSKVKDVYTDIDLICKALKVDTKTCDHNLISISFVKKTNGNSGESLDGLPCSFMYTQILKEILLTINFESAHFNDFLTYCRTEFADNTAELKYVDMIADEYARHRPIWWYTYECFLYSMLNRALRTMEVDLIIKMGFFLKDLHNHILTLHKKQFGEHHQSNSFFVYRGQCLSQSDFNELQQTQGGLLSFNNFLSTSTNRSVSLEFAQSVGNTSNSVGVLFVMKIDPSIPTTPFANVKTVSYYEEEGEILLSMHSIFRIGEIKQIEGNSQLWQVDLTLTSDNDPELQTLTERIRQETHPDEKGWYRLGTLLIKLGQYDKAQQVCHIMLEQTSDEREKASIYHMLGLVKDDQGKYGDAVEYYEKSIKMKQKTLSLTHPDLASSFSNLGAVYYNIDEYPKALSYCEKALEIYQKTLSADHPNLAISYNNIGLVYTKMKKYTEALSYYQHAFEIYQKTLPDNHPDLATSYNNIGLVYDNMGDYTKALEYYQKDLEISQRTLPADHPNLATSYNNIGEVYRQMGDYTKALEYYEKDLEISRRTLSADHPDLATSYTNMGTLCYSMHDYSRSLSYYERALRIRQYSLPANHPQLQVAKQNIETVTEKLQIVCAYF